MNCSTVTIHFQHGNSASPLLYIGYLDSLLCFYVCHWQKRGEGWHLQRNRESCLAAFTARIAVKLLISQPQSSLVFYLTAIRSPAVVLSRLTTLLLQSPWWHPASDAAWRWKVPLLLLQCASPPQQDFFTFSLSSLSSFFLLPQAHLNVSYLQTWGWSQDVKGQENRFMCLRVCMQGEREDFYSSHCVRLEKIN